ncbi:MAG: cupin domain-containing protein [Hyphomonadaceae bacterium]|nr:cupin domain-containing protein [Hyphomonadaceae bacterium]MBX3511721.1 cupin domain-containing protein [Hyphomonadaceae bacterium]
MRAWMLGAAAVLLAGCVSVNAQVRHEPDAALAAFENARLRECPAARVQAGAHASGEAQNAGVTGETIGVAPLASDPTRVVRLRRLTIAPGGAIAWHDHAAVQGMALMVAGEMVETRNSCLDRMTYRAGDVAVEDASTAHSWRNESDAPAIVLTAHVLAR